MRTRYHFILLILLLAFDKEVASNFIFELIRKWKAILKLRFSKINHFEGMSNEAEVVFFPCDAHRDKDQE